MLSEELVIEILLRLPAVKDILRCKCVCKSWCSLVTSPFFVAQHLKLSNTKHPDLLVKYRDNRLDRPMQNHPKISLVSHETLEVVDTQFVLSNTSGIDMKLATKNTIVGCCNGILCFYHDLANVVLWNPATRDAKLVPPPLYCCHPVKRAFYHCLAIGFGFDAKNNDYKVISVQKKGDPLRVWEREFEIEVYSLRTNRWRELQDLQDMDKLVMTAERYKPGVITDGMFSWLVKDVVSFDMSNEVIIITPLPPIPTYKTEINIYSPLSLVFHNGSVAVSQCDKNNCFEYNLWALGRFGVKESWIKISIDVFDYMFILPLGVGIWNNCSVMLFEDERSYLSLLNPTTRESIWTIHNYGRGKTLIMQVFAFKETLVPITRATLLV